MTKTEFINTFANEANLSKAESERMVNTFISCAANAIAKEGSLTFVKFGSFKIRKRKAYTATNPSTREKVKVPAKKVVTFKPGSELKALAAKSKCNAK